LTSPFLSEIDYPAVLSAILIGLSARVVGALAMEPNKFSWQSWRPFGLFVIDPGLCAGLKTLAAQINNLSSENAWRLS
jgi:hypothetical protein